MAHRLEESATLLQVHQGPSQIICARYDKFARDHSDALSNALGDGCQSALCLSLACFEYITGATVWACLFRHDNADVIGIERSIRCYFQSPSVRATLEPLDPDAVVFRYAILPGLRFGPRVSKTGKVLVGRETGGPGKLTSAGDALYSSGDLIDANSTATIGGVVKAWKEDRGWSTFGITIAIPLEGVRDPEALPSTLPQFPERRPTSPSTLPKSRIHRGVSEICVSLTTNPGEPAKRLTVDAYKNRGHGFAQALSCQITNSTTSDAWKGVPWCLIEFGQGISTLAADPTKIHGHITAGIDEPKTDDELIILRKTEHLLRCVVLEPTAWIRPPGPAKFFPARKLRLTLNHSLNPWDIGALVVQETDTHFKAHYQIVALAGSNEAYAVSIRGLIHSLTDAGYTEVAFVSDIDGVGNEASPLPGAPNRDNTAQLVLHPSLIAQPDELSFRNSNLPLVSLGATLDRVPQHSQRVPKAVRSFRNAVQSYTLRNYLNQEFVLIEHLDRWMQKRSTDKARPDNTWLVLLLVDSYELHGGIDNYPSLTRIRHDIKLSSTRSLFRLFCVLLQINAGHLIEALSYFLSDNDLPLTKESLETELTTRRILSSVADAQNLASRFVAEQYFFCPKCLLSRKLTKFNPDEIVPVTRMEPVNDKEFSPSPLIWSHHSQV
ncbi:hypothetical protein B0T16DRAFT_417349 [Cercophora newfieldiana]|uniref:Uncharacterized protein n=1 Tax=Cercophora newfieldiana TaxID=92897 RepID=A0AA40CP64_9PEZI|nr:hypothetical protein B0T16DRAFT_417349 [Cercophora newfieldiana]